MPNDVFNISKGKVAEYGARIVANDPANSAFVVVLAIGAATDATLIDIDTLALVLADAGVTEATFTNYARKIVTNPTVNIADASDANRVDMPDQTWTAAGNGANDTLTRLYVCYDSDTTGGTDANIVPCTFHDFSVLTDGSDLTAQFATNGFFEAT